LARTSRLIEIVLVGLAIMARAAAVLVLESYSVPRSTYEHGEIAANLLAGSGFAMHFLGADGPTSQQAPAYPALVALAFAAGGIESPRALLLLQLAQCVLGGLLALGVLRLGHLVAPGRPLVANAAGIYVALHPTLVYAATHVQVASLGTVLMTWTLVWAYQTGVTRRARDAALTGLWLGLLALTDPILALAMLGIGCAIAQGQAGGAYPIRQCLRLVAVVAAVAIACIGPWIIRNAVVHGEFVPIKSTFGYAFWQGNCALSQGTDKVVRASVEQILDRDRDSTNLKELNRTLWAARHEAGYIDDIALTAADYRMLGAVSEPERSRILWRRALAELRQTPGRYGRLCLRRLAYFIFFDETNPKSRVLAYRLPHIGLTMLAAAGLLAAGRALRRRLLPTIVTAGAITVFHALTIVSARFHIPIEPLLALWGAAGLNALMPLLRSRRSIAARHDIERVGVKGQLTVVERGRVGVGFSRRSRLHAVKDQACDERASADQHGASPRDGVEGEPVVERSCVHG
jgi:hypothetical protein